jgi:sterol desaturase/sphingolipid hydroxylase (fatty acid hydroxylase superfamily)
VLYLFAIQIGIDSGHAVMGFNVAYLALAILIAAAERLLPHERSWLTDDGQMTADLLHTLVSKGGVQLIVVAWAVIGLASIVPSGVGPWPSSWPMSLQIVLGLLIAEFGLYWRHRLAHQWVPLWRFHAVHHSAPRLWFWNTGRFHIVDTLAAIVASTFLLWIAGAPAAVYQWVGAIAAAIGLLTHCNVEMRCGFISLVFNTPNLHRWHHSTVAAEGNRNYGEMLVLFDQIFGTYFSPRDRRPPAVIGVLDPMPAGFLAQVAEPFRRRRVMATT